MLGAIAGDVIGSVYERHDIKDPDFQPLFDPAARLTDDTVLTCAVAEWVLRGAGDDLVDRLHDWFARFPHAGYGGTFIRWAAHRPASRTTRGATGRPCGVSPVGFAFDTLEETLEQAKRSAEVTHNHPHGIAGAKAVAGCVFLARTGHSKDDIREFADGASATTCPGRSTIFGPATVSTCRARGPSRRRSSRSSNRPAGKTPSARRFPWAGTRTRSRPSPAALRARFMVACRVAFAPKLRPGCHLRSG